LNIAWEIIAILFCWRSYLKFDEYFLVLDYMRDSKLLEIFYVVRCIQLYSILVRKKGIVSLILLNPDVLLSAVYTCLIVVTPLFANLETSAFPTRAQHLAVARVSVLFACDWTLVKSTASTSDWERRRSRTLLGTRGGGIHYCQQQLSLSLFHISNEVIDDVQLNTVIKKDSW